MSFKHNAKDSTRNDGVKTSNLKNDCEHVLPPQRTKFKEGILGRSRWMKRSITIYGRDQATFRESSLPVDDRCKEHHDVL